MTDCCESCHPDASFPSRVVRDGNVVRSATVCASGVCASASAKHCLDRGRLVASQWQHVTCPALPITGNIPMSHVLLYWRLPACFDTRIHSSTCLSLQTRRCLAYIKCKAKLLFNVFCAAELAPCPRSPVCNGLLRVEHDSQRDDEAAQQCAQREAAVVLHLRVPVQAMGQQRAGWMGGSQARSRAKHNEVSTA